MKKLLYVALFVIGAASFWQCDDPEWESGAIGTWGSPDLTLPIEGGTRTVKFSTTKAWSASVQYPEGATSKTWCAVAPMNGPAGDGMITISAGPNDTYEDRVANVIIYSGSESKTYTVTMPCQGEMSAKETDFLDLSFNEQIIGVPILHNVGYELSVPDDAKEWISQVDDSKAMPTVDTLYLRISEYRSGLITRKAVLTVFNKDKGYVEKINVSQLPGPSLFIASETAIDGNKQTVNIELVASESWTVTPDPKAPWCVLTSAASGEKGGSVLSFSIGEALTKSRVASLTVTADTMVRTFTIKQTELGVENGYYIQKGDLKSYSSASLVDANGTVTAFYTGPLGAPSGGTAANVFAGTVYNQVGSGKQFTHGNVVALRIKVDYPTKSMKQSFSGSWKSASLKFRLYRWNMDYATTIASTPLITNAITPGSAHYQLLNSGDVVPVGEYLAVMEETQPTNDTRYWTWSAMTSLGVQCFRNGKQATDSFPEFYYERPGDLAEMMQTRSKTTSDGGKTWTDGKALSFNDVWLAAGVSPQKFALTKGSDFYYATFDRANKKNVSVARCATTEGTWLTWDGADWSVKGSAGVWPATAVTIVENGGKIYAYYLAGSDVMVTSAPSGDKWPASLSAPAVAYTFGEEFTPSSIDVKFHATGNQFVATYVDAQHEVGRLVSTDGTTFSAAAALDPDAGNYVWAGATDVRYAVSTSGVVNANSYISYSRKAGTTGLYMFSAK